MIRGTKVAYYGVGFAHGAVVFYYCSVALLATLGLVLQNVMLGTTHLFLFAGIAGSQVASGKTCPLTNLQNRFGKKLGKTKMESFIGRTLDTVIGWEPRSHNVRRATITATAIIFAYYGIVHFGPL